LLQISVHEEERAMLLVRRAIKNWNWGNIFGGKFLRNAWHRMRQFCVQQPIFFCCFTCRLFIPLLLYLFRHPCLLLLF